MTDWLEKSAWMVRAHCAEIPGASAIFFDDDRLDEARAICAQCQVFDDCLAYGTTFSMLEDDTGVYAGMLPRQRRTYVRTERKRRNGK